MLSGQIEPGMTAGVLLGLMMAMFVLVALAIDRRSLLAPTLAYFGSVGIYYLVNGAANTTGIPPFALILIAVGAIVILFGRRLAAHPALDYPPASSHIAVEQASPDKGMIPT